MRNHLQIGIVPISLAIIAFIGCGGDPSDGYDFQGNWNGTLSSNQAPCSDGSHVPTGSTKIAVTIISDGNKQIVAHAQCGDLYFTQAGNMATQSRAVTCPPVTAPTSQVTQTIHDTSLVLSVNALQVDLISDYAVSSNGMSSVCNNIPSTGVLIRTGS